MVEMQRLTGRLTAPRAGCNLALVGSPQNPRLQHHR